MLSEYFPLLVLLLVVLGFCAAGLVVSDLLGHKRKTRGKLTTYECGMKPSGSARGRFSVKFFLVAVCFLLFDIESLFLIPWGVNLKVLSASGHGPFLFVEMLSFVFILVLGLVYMWKKGGLEWD